MNIITRCRGIKGKIHIFNCWGFRGCVRGRGGWTGRNKPTPFCAKDEKVQINDSGRRRGVWSNRRASQMQLTQGIANARSTLPNIISPRLPPRHIWEPNKLVGKGRSRGGGGGEAPLPAAPPAAPRQRRSRRGNAPCPGQRGRPARLWQRQCRPRQREPCPRPACPLETETGECWRAPAAAALQQVRGAGRDGHRGVGDREGDVRVLGAGRGEAGSSWCTPSGLCVPEGDLRVCPYH